MKKTILLIAAILLTVGTSRAQSLSLGANVGLPTGDASDVTSFQLGGDLSYRFGLAGLVEVGPMIGYSHFFVDSGTDGINMSDNDWQFIPIAASGRVNIISLRAGLDLGYAMGLNNGNDGGLYYRPSVGFNILMLGLIVSYQAIDADGGNFSSINLGVEFDL